MAKRVFKLPHHRRLTKDQDKALRLPRDGQFLVIGGPGTGKSVVALLHTIGHQEDNSHIFLTYNHLLREFTRQYVQDSIDNKAAYSWFYKTYYRLTGKFVPEVEDRQPDYDRIIQEYEELNLDNPETLYFVVDEGQDLPQGFYESVMALGHENFFIVADQNQQITEDNSSIQELTDMLALERSDVIELKQNYRNTREIAVLSQHFYTDKASPKPGLPRNSTLEIPVLPVLYEYELVDNCVKMMLREADRDPGKLIGLIVATDLKRDDYVRRLKNTDIERDYEKPLISSYKYSDKGRVEIDFSQGGIVVITDQSCKGLEFDVVFILLDGFKLYGGDTVAMKKRLYVMTSRAIKRLVFFVGSKNTQVDPEVIALLPEDETMLKRDTI
jgi:DNA helicase IV